jgi:DNA-binding response OmpR family regulator
MRGFLQGSAARAEKRRGGGSSAGRPLVESGSAEAHVSGISKVLVVDDDPAVRLLVCDVLTAYGFAAVSAADGFTALRMVQSERPDCVILDVMMPGIDGHTVLRRIREAEGGDELPVVMLTAAADDAQAWQAWTEGVDYFLAKPFDPDELMNFLEYLQAS